MNKNSLRTSMLESPSYWVEGVNGYLYDAIAIYMEQNNLKQKDLAKHLNISAGRVSQILNDGEINFSLEKIIEIALKVGKYPDFRFEDKKVFLEKEKKANDLFEAYTSNYTPKNIIQLKSKLGSNSSTRISRGNLFSISK